MHDSILIVGLESTKLQRISEHCNIKCIDIGSIGNYLSEESLSDFFFSTLDDHAQEKNMNFLLFYQTPWGFLEGQIKEGSPFLSESADIESITHKMLALWQSYQHVLLDFIHHYKERCLLLNEDRLDNTDDLASLVKERFEIEFPTPGTPLVDLNHDEAISSTGGFFQIIDILAPKCLDLYSNLESSADLLGRTPEFGVDMIASYKKSAIDFLKLTYHVAHIEEQLTSLQDDRERLLTAVSAGDKKCNAEAQKHKETQEEAELLLLQLHQVQEELETLFTRLHTIEGLLIASKTPTEGSLEDRLKQLIDANEQRTKSEEKEQSEASLLENENKELKKESEHLLAKIMEADEKLTVEKQQHKEAQEESELLLLQLHQVQEELEHYFLLYQKSNPEQAEEKQADQTLSVPQSENDQKKYDAPVKDQSLTLNPFKMTKNIAKKLIDRLSVNSQMKSIKASGLFDEKWYLQEYPDVEREKVNSIKHYMLHGYKEGRNPSPNFDTLWYLEAYPEVAAEKINPLFHYIKYGQNEGRKPMRFM